jgi:hypothetical protein
MAENTSKPKVPPPVVNFDQSQNIPGSQTPRERFNQELTDKHGKDPVSLPKLPKIDEPTLPSYVIPKIPPKHATMSKVETVDEKLVEKVASEEINKAVPMDDNPEPVIPSTESHSTETIAAAIETHDDTVETKKARSKKRMTQVDVPEDLTQTPPAEDVSTVPPQEIELPTKEVEDMSQKEYQEEIPETTVETAENLPKDVSQQMDNTAPVINDDALKGDDKVQTSITEDSEESLKKNEDADIAGINENVDTPEGPFVDSMTDDQATKILTDEMKKENNDILKSSKEYTDAQCIALQDQTQKHFKILEAINPDVKKLKERGGVDLTNVKITKAEDIPDYELRSVAFDNASLDGERRTQVVALQSGYVCQCKAMSSRELRTFGRREANMDSYGYEMAICHAIYSKICEISIGALKFDQWMNATAYPDLQTLIFGIYHATYPGKNMFTFDCPYCRRNVTVNVDSGTLACIPPGSMAPEMINTALNGKIQPKELMKMSNRWTAVDIYTDNMRRFFRVRTPSIFEFLENAYHNKRDEMIQDNIQDMIYAGYVRGVGTLDIKQFAKTGTAEYFYDTRIETIDRAIANISPDEKRSFERKIINYITKFSVAYQIPRVRCANCGRIINQRDINTRSLFFDVKTQKGF